MRTKVRSWVSTDSGFGAGVAGQFQQVARRQQIGLTAAEQRAGQRRVFLDRAFNVGFGKDA